MTTSQSLFADEPKPSGPVECLGQTFSSDEARCEHYLAILREKLKDPAFRKLDGFPIGTDEDILALSDPPTTPPARIPLLRISSSITASRMTHRSHITKNRSRRT